MKLFILVSLLALSLIGCSEFQLRSPKTTLEAPKGKTTVDAAKDEAKCKMRTLELPPRYNRLGERLPYESTYYVQCMIAEGYTLREVKEIE